jgi:hypothetical protein
MPTDDRALRNQLLDFLRSDSAHVDLATVLDNFPEELRERKPEDAPFNPWQLLEHMRFTLNDLLVFSTDPNYLAPKWPDEYWPAKDAASSDWEKSVEAFKADFAAFEELIQNPKTNLYAKIPWGDGQTLLREIMLACDHTSYHLGQMVLLKKQLGGWKA